MPPPLSMESSHRADGQRHTPFWLKFVAGREIPNASRTVASHQPCSGATRRGRPVWHIGAIAPLPVAAGLARAAPPLDCSLEYSRLIFRIKCPLGDNMHDGVGHENVKVLPGRDELVKPGPAVK